MCSQVGCHGWTWRCRLRLLLMGTTHIRKLRRILVQCHIGKLALLLRLHRLRCLGLLWVVRLVSWLSLIVWVIWGKLGLRWWVLVVPTIRDSCWQRYHSEGSLLLWNEIGLGYTCCCESRYLDLRVVVIWGAWRRRKWLKRRLLLLLPCWHTCCLMMGHGGSLIILVIVMKCLLTELSHLLNRRIIPMRSWLNTLTNLSSNNIAVRCL